ncbi:MAG TPA: hypothetical protein VJQ47_11715 [Steroidobacteraceae bacterium]|nr:hypothetical protein [Steroidobacteraceae bacterium]
MTRNLHSRAPAARQRGQSMLEFTLISAGLTLLLFTQTPVGQVVANAIRQFYINVSFFLSLP